MFAKKTSGRGAAPIDGVFSQRRPVFHVYRRLFPPLLLMLPLLFVLAAVLLWQLHQSDIDRRVKLATASLAREFGIDVRNQARGLQMLAESLGRLPDLQRKLAANDVAGLASDWSPLFGEMRRQHGLTHLRFLDRNRVCLLRLQQNGRCGERVDRFTAREAERTGRAAYGLELDAGTRPSLFLVQPVFRRGQLLGYVEFGKDVDGIFRDRVHAPDLSLAVLLHKSVLDRSRWHELAQQAGQSPDWDRMPDSVVYFASQGRLPDAFLQAANHDPGSGHRHGELLQEIGHEGRVWRVSASPLKEASGREIGCLFLMTDVTDEHQGVYRTWLTGALAGGLLLLGLLVFVHVMLRRTDLLIHEQEEGLRRGASFLERMLETIPVPVFYKDKAGRYTGFNHAFETFFGVSRERMLGKTVFDLFPSDLAQLYSDKDAELLAHGGIQVYESQVCNSQGERREVIFHKATLIDEREGEVLRLIGVFFDLTERKRAERELSLAIAQVEALALESEKAARVKADFLANMSHEIRTPLNVVLGINQLLLDSSLTLEQREHAELVQSSGRHLLRLINEILDLSRVESGCLQLEQADFNPVTLLEELVAGMRPIAETKGLLLDLNLDSGIPEMLSGDAGRLRQILSNLLGNAIKFTAQGKVSVAVSPVAALPGRQAEVFLRFSVKDSGIGIPENRLDQVFEKFEQADASVTRRFGGTGLGLAICRQLVRLMGGEIGVTSTPGLGSEFWFVLPCQPGRHVAQKASPMPGLSSGQTLLQVDRRLPVLIVDDVDSNRLVARKFMNQLGYDTREADNGLQALEAISMGTAFALVLMDCQMPVMDGLEVTRRVRALEQREGRRHLPIVALTAGAFEENRQECLDAGMDAFLAKPLSLHELQALLSGSEPSLSAENASVAPIVREGERDSAAMIIEMDSALERLDGDRELYEQLLGSVRQQLEEDRSAIGAAWQEGDRQRLQKVCHRLKSSLTLIGSERAAAASRQLEMAAKEGKTEIGQELLDGLMEELAVLAEALYARSGQVNH